MAFRFYRRLGSNLLRLNFSKSGLSLTTGIPGAHVNVPVINLFNNRRRNARMTVGLPGTGLSYRKEMHHAATSSNRAFRIFIAIWIIALLAIAANLSKAHAADDTKAQEYRMWSAEQMINRLTEKFARARKLCDQTKLKVSMPSLSEECKTSVLSAYPILTTIREVAMSGDEVRWTELIDRIHKFEAEVEAPMNNLARR